MRSILALALLALALTGCTIISHSPDGTWTYRRFGGQNSVEASLTSDTLHVVINPHPETTADIINAAANAAMNGAGKGLKP